MGVKGLWDVLRPAATTQSIPRLAIDGFNKNLDGNRGLRVGIDASIWFGHTEKIKNRSKMGKNHTLRNLFFRCAHMLEVPLLPLFVFDGEEKPLVKRGKLSHFKKSKLVEDMQELLDAFGFQWHPAPGEAEAELAHLNRIGVIDAVWTDDVDVFLFGAARVLRNPSNTLSGNATNPILNAEGRDDGKHVAVLSACDLESHPDVLLTRASLILIALLRGGDYDEGVPQIGMQIAYGLARCGFGNSLLNSVESLKGKQLSDFIKGWRADIVSELRSDSQGFLRKKHAKLAQSFPADFPKLDVLAAYVKPVVSDQKKKLPRLDWDRKLDISALAGVCKRSFGWDDNTLLKRFASLVWPGAAMRVLRDTIVSTERNIEMQNAGPDAAATGSSGAARASSLIVGTHRQRKHASTDYLPEIRVEIDPTHFIESARLGISSTQQHLPIPQSSNARLWLPVCIVQLAVPQFAHTSGSGHTEQHTKKRRRGNLLTHDDHAASAVVETGHRKVSRGDGDRALMRGGDSNKLTHAQSPVIDLTVESDSDVIIIRYYHIRQRHEQRLGGWIGVQVPCVFDVG